MQYRALGNTGITVSAIGFGGWAIGGNQFGNSYGHTDDTESLKALNRAYELGCTLFDTADVYGHGHSETLMGQALKGWNREQVVLATKVGGNFYGDAPRLDFSPQYIRFALEQSLKRLGTDRIDVYQLHNPPMPFIEQEPIFEVLQALRNEGKIRSYGLSIFDPQEGIQAFTHGNVQTIQVVYNLFDRRPEDKLLNFCTQNEIGLIAREPLANGFLSGKYTGTESFEPGDIRAQWPPAYLKKRADMAQAFEAIRPAGTPTLAALALQFVLAQPAVSVVIPGSKTVAQVESNFKAADLPPLSSDVLTRLALVPA